MVFTMYDIVHVSLYVLYYTCISNGMFYISHSTYPMVCTGYHIVHVPLWKMFVMVQMIVWKEIQLPKDLIQADMFLAKKRSEY